MGSESDEVPTYYANFVSMNMNVDELVLEFRSYNPFHKENWEKAGAPESGEIFDIPPVTMREIYDQRPAARVVVTFSAAQAIRQYLNRVMDKMLAARKGQ